MSRALLAIAALALPGLAVAEETGRRDDPVGQYSLPAGAFDGTEVPQQSLDARRETVAWSRPLDAETTPLSVFETLASEIEDGGGRILFRCAAADCGGFDFRSGIELLPPPQMYLDLSEFYALGAETGTGDGLRLLVVSRTASQVFWQQTTLLPATVAPVGLAPETAPVPGPEAGDLAAELDAEGFAVLEDVSFATGADTLGEEVPASLPALAAYLAAHPGYRATIVGHSDASGKAAANMDLSQRRAASVRSLLVDGLGLAPERVAAAGVGALAPRATNATEEGRRKNRRVEVVIGFE
ncbi:OmpA family protein [Poseidonocella sp. HB161398]|uniref:OmpA family protein n=1 Tax=Poseidonocella sp. HB161398 TaxID=2320855 RepID=UPI001107FF26|nr:OmpA family protein [Poseidonocella sp. HB161398]